MHFWGVFLVIKGSKTSKTFRSRPMGTRKSKGTPFWSKRATQVPVVLNQISSLVAGSKVSEIGAVLYNPDRWANTVCRFAPRCSHIHKLKTMGAIELSSCSALLQKQAFKNSCHHTIVKAPVQNNFSATREQDPPSDLDAQCKTKDTHHVPP